jgi:hypothetical protein
MSIGWAKGNTMASVTDQQILDALRTAYFNLAVSGAQSYTINGRTFNRVDIDKLKQQISEWEARIDAAGQPGIGGGTLLTRFGQI